MSSHRRLLWCSIASMLLILAAVGAPVPATAAQQGFPDVDMIVIAEVQDADAWLTLHQEVLATPPGAAKPLRVSLPARTGGGRAIDIEHPRFTVALIAAGGKPQVKVTIAGKVNSSMALTMLMPFQQAAMDVQAGAVVNDLTMSYGLSVVAGHLLEVYFDRQ